ncbi:trypsin II-P29-like [Vespa velutina]|uniref:trypsin II-P29-like n=1 Tax=Vespa velutina TaxID=202808 RepID=UPI001FB254E0|nr:trypsin II-P29-like [Vespa velutina]
MKVLSVTLIGIRIFIGKKLESNVNLNCDCGISIVGPSNHVIGEKISKPHNFPWIVVLLNAGAIHCGGALINDRYILTAGHCVKWLLYFFFISPSQFHLYSSIYILQFNSNRTNAKDMTVGLGIHDVDDPNDGYIVSIDKMILHENFTSHIIHDNNDIALIKLKNLIKYDDHVQPICFPNKDAKYTGQMVKVTGWGAVAVNGATSKFLRETNLNVLSLDSCKNTSIGKHLTNSVICAYNDNTDACQGDSGGPIFIERPNGKNEIIGIVSWGLGCANKGVPGVYVKITDYLNWIKENTADAIYCKD